MGVQVLKGERARQPLVAVVCHIVPVSGLTLAPWRLNQVAGRSSGQNPHASLDVWSFRSGYIDVGEMRSVATNPTGFTESLRVAPVANGGWSDSFEILRAAKYLSRVDAA